VKRTTRQKIVHVRLSEDEFLALEAFCAEVQLSVSVVLRRLARDAGGLGPALDGEAVAAFRGNSEELRRIGVNLNQLVRALSGGSEARMEELLAGLGRLARLVGEQAEAINVLCGGARDRARRQVSADA